MRASLAAFFSIGLVSAAVADSQSFDEPQTRFNLQPLDAQALGWSEGAFWDAYALEGGR